MFDFLKKRIGGFIDGLTKKEEMKEELPPEKRTGPVEKEKPEPKKTAPERKETKAPPKHETPKPAPKKAEPVPEPKTSEPETSKSAPRKEKAKPPEKKAPEPRTILPKAPAPKAIQPKPGTPKPKEAEPPPKPKKIPEPPPEPEEIPEPEPAPLQPETEKEPEPEEEPGPPETEEEETGTPEPEEEPEERAPIPEPETPEAPPAPEPQAKPETESAKPKPAEPEKPKERVKLGFFGAVKSIITREVEISEGDVKDMLDSLELELLEADVDMGVAEGIKEELSSRLIGSKVPKKELHSFVSGSIRDTLLQVLTSDRMFGIEEKLEASEKPLKIMFIGINGAGKTTTIAKVANMLQKKGRKVVFAAADTFRAAAIEQMEVHAQRLGVKMIKREYGSDPTSVAYDAVNYAKAHNIDAVLIDTAGRQDTNISLLNEMKKMGRVIQPDLKIYIGESIAGNAIIEQVSAFDREVGIDGVILTKLDCDPKGGTMLSLSKATGVPIIYVGMGQGYDDLEPFDPERIVARILE